MDVNLDLDVAGVGKMGVRLIEKASDAAGVLYEPTRITRRAKAEAKAEIMRAKADVEIADIQRRAAQRFVNEQMLMQANMEEIIGKAIPHINEDASPEDMSNDWLLNFFDKSRMVSEDEMQELWARVLAGEADNPGLYSRKTINLLADIEAEDARLFKQLSDFRLMPTIDYVSDFNEQAGERKLISSSEPTLVIFDWNHRIYERNGVNHQSLMRLEWLELVRRLDGGYISHDALGRTLVYEHSGGYIYLANGTPFSVGNIEFTVAGEQLSELCTPLESPNGYVDYITEIWRSRGVDVRHDISEVSATQSSSTV